MSDLVQQLKLLPADAEAQNLLDQANSILNQTFLADDDGPALVQLLENLGFAKSYPGAHYVLAKLYEEGLEPALEVSEEKALSYWILCLGHPTTGKVVYLSWTHI